MVRRADQEGDQATAPRSKSERDFDRLLLVRHDEGDGSCRQGEHASPQNAEYLVLNADLDLQQNHSAWGNIMIPHPQPV